MRYVFWPHSLDVKSWHFHQPSSSSSWWWMGGWAERDKVKMSSELLKPKKLIRSSTSFLSYCSVPAAPGISLIFTFNPSRIMCGFSSSRVLVLLLSQKYIICGSTIPTFSEDLNILKMDSKHSSAKIGRGYFSILDLLFLARKKLISKTKFATKNFLEFDYLL